MAIQKGGGAHRARIKVGSRDGRRDVYSPWRSTAEEAAQDEIQLRRGGRVAGLELETQVPRQWSSILQEIIVYWVRAKTTSPLPGQDSLPACVWHNWSCSCVMCQLELVEFASQDDRRYAVELRGCWACPSSSGSCRRRRLCSTMIWRWRGWPPQKTAPGCASLDGLFDWTSAAGCRYPGPGWIAQFGGHVLPQLRSVGVLRVWPTARAPAGRRRRPRSIGSAAARSAASHGYGEWDAIAPALLHYTCTLPILRSSCQADLLTPWKWPRYCWSIACATARWFANHCIAQVRPQECA